MRPPDAEKDAVNRASRNAVSASKARVGNAAESVFLPHGANLVGGQACSGVAFSARDAPLPRCVQHVLPVGAEPEVGGLDARRSIAVVADEHPARDGAVEELPCNPMGTTNLALGVDPSVAIPVQASSEKEATRLKAYGLACNLPPSGSHLRPCRVDATLLSTFHSSPRIRGGEPRGNRLGALSLPGPHPEGEQDG